jgi:hypothetical protein
MFARVPYVSSPSATRLSGNEPDPWLCVPASRRVCLFREGVFAMTRNTLSKRHTSMPPPGKYLTTAEIAKFSPA